MGVKISGLPDSDATLVGDEEVAIEKPDGKTQRATITKLKAGLPNVLNKEQLAKDGSVTATGDLPMGGFKITGIGAPVSSTDAARKSETDAVQTNLDTLESDLASSDANKGASKVSYDDGVTVQERLPVDNLKELADATALQVDGLQVQMRAFYSDTDTGGGHFYWDADRAKSDANGGTIIDPDNVGTLSATALGTFLSQQGAGSGTGCWVRLDASFPGATNTIGRVSAVMFGARTGGSSEYDAIQAALDTKLPEVFLPAGDYGVASTLKVYPDQRFFGAGRQKTNIKSSVSGSSGAGNEVPAVATADASGVIALDSKDLGSNTFIENIRIYANGVESIGLQFAGTFNGGVRRVNIEKEAASEETAGNRTGKGLVITGLDKASQRGLYYNDYDDVLIEDFAVGFYYGSNAHSNAPINSLKIFRCDAGIRFDDGTDLGFTTNVRDPISATFLHPDIEIIDGNAVENIIGGHKTFIAGYYDGIGGDVFVNEGATTTIISPHYTSITGSDITVNSGNVKTIDGGFDQNANPLARVAELETALMAPNLHDASDNIAGLPNAKLLSGEIDISGTGSSPVASGTVTFSNYQNLPSSVTVAAIWTQVRATGAGGSSGSLYTTNYSGFSPFSGNTSFTVHVRTTDGSNIGSGDTIVVRWFAIAYVA